MNTTARRGFWVTNHLANPILRPLLRGPLGRPFGRRLAVLRYKGRRSGQQRELVVQYVRDGNRVWIVPGQPDRKRWWRNMLEPHTVELWLAGEHLSGVARVLTNAAGEEQVQGLAAYRSVFPRVMEAAVMVRVDAGHDPPGEPDGS